MVERNNQQPALFTPGPAGTWRPAAPLSDNPTTGDPPARRSGPLTSHIAAASMRGSAKTIRARVLRYFIDCGRDGATNEEMASALGLRAQTATARTNELAKLGVVRDSDDRRPTSSGRSAIVWIATSGAEARA